LADTTRDDNTGPQGTRVFQRDDIAMHVTERREQPRPAGRDESGGALIGINGVHRGRRFGIPSGRSTLGRDLNNDIVVDDDSVSLVHARLIEKDGQWRVLNLLSTNGTWINNKKVSDGPLRNGDSVCFGEAEFIFQYTGDSKPAGIWSALRRWLVGARH
jgi:hypothetical protein